MLARGFGFGLVIGSLGWYGACVPVSKNDPGNGIV